ncbi:MAG: AMP-binding protein [Cyanobacteria bacterium J06642_2]
MISSRQIWHSPPHSGRVELGRSLPALLDEACDRYPNPQALRQFTKTGWQTVSNLKFRAMAEALALGLRELGLNKGDRVGLVLPSDLSFCLADMGCLMAGLVDVPINPSLNMKAIAFQLDLAEVRAVIVSDAGTYQRINPYLGNETIAIVADPIAEHASALKPSELKPSGRQVRTLIDIRNVGRLLRAEAGRGAWRDLISPQDVATIVYTAGADGTPLGVMLTHENISAAIIATFTGTPDVKPGAETSILSFLPLTHVFARSFFYGHVFYGHSITLATPRRFEQHLKQVQPTLIATVPRVLEKIQQKILRKGNQLKGRSRSIFIWAASLADRYELGRWHSPWYALQLKLADWLVFSRWREALGGKLRFIVCGGAAVPADIANFFSAAGMTVMQGYGLTETGSVICCNRDRFNRAGTVGVPVAGVEMAISNDGEILVRGACVMQGYFNNSTATEAVLDADGWLHTGDVGKFTTDGFLRITGYKKHLFKLSTGEYVMPLPLEQQLERSPLVKRAVVVGIRRKFCGMAIVPEADNLRREIGAVRASVSLQKLIELPESLALYQALINEANRQMPRWSRVKRFELVREESHGCEVDEVRRDGECAPLQEAIAPLVAGMYAESEMQPVAP